MVKKVSFYIRFENDTGGDETFLFTLAQPIIKGLQLRDSGEKIEVGLVLTHDGKSQNRAKKVQKKWENIRG